MVGVGAPRVALSCHVDWYLTCQLCAPRSPVSPRPSKPRCWDGPSPDPDSSQYNSHSLLPHWARNPGLSSPTQIGSHVFDYRWKKVMSTRRWADTRDVVLTDIFVRCYGISATKDLRICPKCQEPGYGVLVTGSSQDNLRLR
jgi:hypothetical protein